MFSCHNSSSASTLSDEEQKLLLSPQSDSLSLDDRQWLATAQLESKNDTKDLRQQRNLSMILNAVLLVIIMVATTFWAVHSNNANEQRYSSWSWPLPLASQRTTLKDMIASSQSFRQTNNDSVQVVMVAKDITKPFCQSVLSMLVNGFPAPHVMHYQQPYHGWADKLESFDEYLSTPTAAKADTLFLLDGYDLVFQLPLSVAIDRHRRSGKDLFFGADKRCWPVRNDEAPCTRMPQSVLANDIYGEKTDIDPWNRPRWLNAGAVIGSTSSLRSIMKEAWKRAQEKAAANLEVNDQGILADILTEDGAPYSFTTDSASTIFQTMIISESDIVWDVNPDPKVPSTVESPLASSQRAINLTDLQMQTPSQRAASFWMDRPLARNIRSNEIPVALHFNGPDQKLLMQKWWTFNWFARPEVREEIRQALQQESEPNGAGIWIGDDWHSWNDVCGHFEIL